MSATDSAQTWRPLSNNVVDDVVLSLSFVRLHGASRSARATG